MSPGIRDAVRGRFEMRPGLHQPHYVRNGAILVALAALVLVSAVSGHIPFVPKGGHVVKAEFMTNNVLRRGYPVRVAGVDVGKIDSIKHAPDGRGVIVGLRLNSKNGDIKLHDDARADLYWRTLLGGSEYVALDPGSPSAPPLQGMIPASRTSSQVEVDEVLRTLDRPARASVQTLVRAFETGFSDPQASREALRRLSPTMGNVAPALKALRGEESGDLSTLVAETSKAMGGLGRDEVSLGNLVDDADVTFGVTAARRADLASMLQAAPSAMAQVQQTSGRLHTTLDRLDPLAAALRPGVRRLDPAAQATTAALERAQPVLRSARPLVERLHPALRRLAAASVPGAQFFRGLDPALDRAREPILPFLKQRNPETKLLNYEAIGPTISAVDSISSNYDALGHYLVFEPGVGDHVVGTLPCQEHLNDPNAARQVECDALAELFKHYFGGAPAPNDNPRPAESVTDDQKP